MAIYLLGKTHRFFVAKGDITPNVSIIIAAFNESNDIEKKILNTLSIDYPEDKYEILIGSDGSTDNTSMIIGKYVSDQLRFFDFKDNRGKTAVQNDLVANAKNDILVFTDAASFLPKDSVRMIVRNFADSKVGCVAGNMRFVSTDENITTQSQGVYWNYERKIRQWESNVGSLIGVDGPLYAMRKDNYVKLDTNIISDLMTPLLVLDQNKKVVLERESYVDEEAKKKNIEEFQTRRRITLRGMVGVFAYPQLLNPKRNLLLSVQLLFHKIIRWWVGPLVVINTISCVILAKDNSFFLILLLVYILFYCAALLGWKCSKEGKKSKLFTIPYYFCLVNLSASLGIYDYFRKRQAITWKTVR
jgi:cellulose synthase/poly-beta-1,6-N-acetylglucosamine synthase-like glycosyltransferase